MFDPLHYLLQLQLRSFYHPPWSGSVSSFSMQCAIDGCVQTTRRSTKTIFRWSLLCDECHCRGICPRPKEIEDHRQRTLLYIQRHKADTIAKYVYQRDIMDLEHQHTISQINKRLAAIE